MAAIIGGERWSMDSNGPRYSSRQMGLGNTLKTNSGNLRLENSNQFLGTWLEKKLIWLLEIYHFRT